MRTSAHHIAKDVVSASTAMVLVLGSACAFGQAVAGSDREGLLGGWRVPLAAEPRGNGRIPSQFRASVYGGYAVQAESGMQAETVHRGVWSASLGARIAPWLSAAARVEGRYEVASIGGQSFARVVHEPAFAVQLGTRVSARDVFAAAVRLDATFLAGPDGVVNGSAARVDLMGVASVALPLTPLSFGVVAGFRFDSSANALLQPGQVAAVQRAGLGLSSWNAVIVGAVFAAHVGPLRVFGEARWEPLVGTQAPPLSYAPLHLRTGVNLRVTRDDSVTLGLVLDGAPYQRRLGMTAGTLTPMDPAFSALLTASFAWSLPTPMVHSPVRTITPVITPIQTGTGIGTVIEPESATLRGCLKDESGQPLAGARVQIGNPVATEVATGDDGCFSASEIPLGPTTITYIAPGHKDRVIQVDVTPETTQAPALSTTMEHVVLKGQLRGRVLSFGGASVENASVRIVQTNALVPLNADGSFNLELATGAYDVEIQAAGFERQQRHIELRENEVVILNVDLRSSGGRGHRRPRPTHRRRHRH